MRNIRIAEKIVEELDISRPVVVLLWGGNEQMAKAILDRISPTSRLFVFSPGNATSSNKPDEPIEMIESDESLETRMRIRYVAAFDAVILNASSVSEEDRQRIFERVKSVLTPSGQLILFPFSKDFKEHLARDISWEKEFMMWRSLPPFRVVVGRKKLLSA